MKNRIENGISMFKTVKAVCDANIATIDANVGVKNTYEQFLSMLDDVGNITQEQILVRTGITENKRDAREQLALMLESATGIIKVHAGSVRDHELYASVDFPISYLLKMRDHLLIAYANNVVGALTVHQAELVAFSVDAGYISELSKVLKAYINIVAMPTMARNDKGTATVLLDDKVKAMHVFLKEELDNAMLVLKSKNTAFFITYRKARRMVNNGIRHLKLGSISGVVRDAASNEVLADSLIELVGTDTVVVTNELGEFTIVNVPPSTYTIKASTGDYGIETIANISVTANEDTELEIKLIAA